MRKRELKQRLDETTRDRAAAYGELSHLRVLNRRLEDERDALQSELATERLVKRTTPSVPAHPQVVEGAPSRRIVHLQATVIDEAAEQGSGGGPVTPDEEAWHDSIRERLVRGCRDAENLLSVADSSPVVRAARYALAFALRDAERIAGDAQRELAAGEAESGESLGLPAGAPAAAPEPDARG